MLAGVELVRKTMTEAEFETVWESDELHALRVAAQRYSRKTHPDKNKRWKLIAKEIGKSKRECYRRYQELKVEQSELRRCPSDSSVLSSVRTVSSDSLLSSGGNSVSSGASAMNASTISSAKSFGSRASSSIRKFRKSNSSRSVVKTSNSSKSYPLPEATPDFSFCVEAKCVHGNAMKEHADLAIYDLHEPAEDSVSECKLSNDSLDTFVEASTLTCSPRTVRSIRTDEARDILSLLVGGAKLRVGLDTGWRKQGFFFGEGAKPRYGLVQLKGGPCGAIAVVQAFVLVELLYGVNMPAAIRWDRPTSEERRRALTEALTTIIWQAGDRVANVCVVDDGVADSSSGTGQMMVHQAQSREDVRDIVDEHIESFMRPQGPGVLLLLFSVILTREDIKSDMDHALHPGETALIGRHNYAGQELVNLLLFGRACSNVFDGKKDLGQGKDKMVLQGVERHCEVGFLTLFEHYGYMQVGSLLKEPLFPVWVLCSESHYSVLFSDGPECLNSSEPFDLYYYDQLGNQEEQYRLTVNPDPDCPVEHSTDESRLVSPIDDCIRTRWPGATVDWNGSDPLL